MRQDSTGSRILSPTYKKKTRGSLHGGANLTYLLMGMGCGGGVWRCGGRMSNSCLSQAEQTPILLDKRDHLAILTVMDAHKRFLHNGVKETLTELRSAYWLVRGRQFIRKLLRTCVVCRRLEGRHCRGIPPPPLPEFARQTITTISDDRSGLCRTSTREVIELCRNGQGVAVPLHMLHDESSPPGFSTRHDCNQFSEKL